jgi:maltose alpha-D-glucosyltransferase/alpha-amylase
VSEDLPILGVPSIDQLFEGRARERLEREVLLRHLPRQRWFSSKARTLVGTRILDYGRIGSTPTPVLTILRAEYEDGASERYSVPLAFVSDATPDALARLLSGPGMAWLDSAGGTLVVDGLADDDSCHQIVSTLADGSPSATFERPIGRGTVRVIRDRMPLFSEDTDFSSLRRTGAEQTNSSIIVGRAGILKMYRKLEPGIHPELEMGRYLWTHGFTDVPQVLASLEYHRDESQMALAVLHALVPDAQDGWQHALEHVRAFYGSRMSQSPKAADAGAYLEAAEVLGGQTGQLHLTLAAATDPAMAPEPLTAGELASIAASARARADRAFAQLTQARANAPASARPRVDALFERKDTLTQQLDALVSSRIDVDKTRCHQDFHLGQLLWTGHRYAFLDFEGEPLRSLPERRRKRSPLTDVAGMLRSYSYAAWSGLFECAADRRVEPLTLESWARDWEAAVAERFLGAYLNAAARASFVPSDASDRERLLRLLTIDKALYELEYELNNRPGWILVPVEGLLRLI